MIYLYCKLRRRNHVKYYKLKVSLNGYEDRFNRILLFKQNSTLDDLAFTVLSTFNTLYYHMYSFKDDKNVYECEISYQEAKQYNYPDIGLQTYSITLDQLIIKNNKFLMIYDFGTNYEFVIEILEEIELKELYKVPRVIEGVGYGIVEDDKTSLENYLNNKKLKYPLLFIKNKRPPELDFNQFDVEKCNKKLMREFTVIRDAYAYY